MQHQGAVATGAESPVATMSGSNYYVATNGDDSNPGTESQPWRTIQKAADAMVAGDTVYVRGGTYSGFHLAESGTEGNLITFKAYPGEQPILDGGSLVGFTDYHGSSVVGYFAIDGFEIRNFAHGIDLGKSRNFVLRNNKVYNNSLTGITLDDCHNGEIHHNTVYENRSHSGIWVSGSTSIDIHHNVAYSNEQNGIGLTHGSDNNLIHHNTAYSNSCRSDQRYAGIGIEVGSENNKTYNNLIYRNCHAGYLTNSPNNEIYHNVIFGNTGAQISLGDWRGSLPTGNIIKNNILVVTDTSDNAIAFWRDATSYDALQNIFDHNLYYYVNGPDKSDMVVVWVSPYSRAYSFAQWRNNAGKEEHGLLNDPQFVDSNHNDFHLRPESPAIDAGANVGVDTDFDGKQRPQAGGFDIGAYEYLGVRLVAWARETTAYLS
jgi:parallel beta-helix repeat protein